MYAGPALFGSRIGRSSFARAIRSSRPSGNLEGTKPALFSVRFRTMRGRAGGYLAVSIALCSARLGLARSPVGVSLSGEHGKEVREWWLAGKGEMRRENLLLLRGGWRRSYEEEPGGCHKGSSRESCLVVRCLDRSAGASATPRNLRTNFVFLAKRDAACNVKDKGELQRRELFFACARSVWLGVTLQTSVTLQEGTSTKRFSSDFPIIQVASEPTWSLGVSFPVL